MTQQVLDGVRVVDFGRYVAGPYCATLLGYLGAEVIRVEKRDGGEDRYIAPVTTNGEGAVFLQTASNKKSLTLDPTHPGAREVMKRLIASADIVVANLPPSTLAKFGLDYASLKSIRTDIILVTQTAFGDQGPYRDQGGFDGVGQAMSGAMYMTGSPGAPAKAAAPYVDFGTAVLSAFGALAALIHRRATGEGQEVKATLLGTALAVFNSHLIEQSVLEINRKGSGNRVQTSAPSDVFGTTDGHILTHCVGNGLFRRWTQLMAVDAASQGLTEPADLWLTDSRFASDQSRGDHSEPILDRMRSWCARRSTAQAIAELTAAGLPAGPVYTPQQALDDPQVTAMGFLHAITDYAGLPRPARVVGLPVQLSRTPGGIHSAPPMLGQHNAELLAELGYTSTEIDALRNDAVI